MDLTEGDKPFVQSNRHPNWNKKIISRGEFRSFEKIIRDYCEWCILINGYKISKYSSFNQITDDQIRDLASRLQEPEFENKEAHMT